MNVLAPAGEWGMTLDQQLDYARERNVRCRWRSAASATAPRRSRAVSVKSGEPASLDIAFERGAPVGVNGVTMPLLDLDGQPRDHRRRARRREPGGVYTPRTTRSRQTAVAKRGQVLVDRRIAQDYLRVLRSGAWFTPDRRALDADADAVQQQVSGVVRLKLFDGDCGVADVRVTPAPKAIVLAKAND